MSKHFIWAFVIFGLLSALAIVLLTACTPDGGGAPAQQPGIELDIDAPKTKKQPKAPKVQQPKTPAAPKPAAPKPAPAPKSGGKR